MSEVITIEQIQESNASKGVIDFFRVGDTHASLDYFVTAHLSKTKQEIAEHHIKHFRNVLDRKMCGRSRRLYKAFFI